MDKTEEYKSKEGNEKRKVEKDSTDAWVKRIKRYESSELDHCMKQLEDTLKDKFVSGVNQQDYEKNLINMATKTIVELTKYK